MKSIKQIMLISLIIIGLSSCRSFGIISGINKKMMSIEKGMTKSEITRLLGSPYYRNFQNENEEWVYITTDKDLIIGFLGGQVESMNTYPSGTYYNRSSNPYGYNSGYPMNTPYPQYPVGTNYNTAQNEREFQQLYLAVNKESLKDNRFAVLRNGMINRAVTCYQCVNMMSLFPYEEDKLQVFSIMAPNIVDLENQQVILNEFKYTSSQDRVRRTIDSLLRR